MKSPVATISSYGEGSKADVVIGVRHNGSFKNTLCRYEDYLQILCPHFDLLEKLHSIEEDTGTKELAHQIAHLISIHTRSKVLVVVHDPSRIIIEQNRLYKPNATDRRLRNVTDPSLNPSLHQDFVQKALNDHAEGDRLMMDALHQLRAGGVYIDLHSMANRCPESHGNCGMEDTSIPLELNAYDLPEYIQKWQNPKGSERDSCFLASLPGGMRMDSEVLTESIRYQLSLLGLNSQINSPYTLSSTQACYRDAQLAQQRGFHISIPDLQKAALADEIEPGIFSPNPEKISQLAHVFYKAIQQTLGQGIALSRQESLHTLASAY